VGLGLFCLSWVSLVCGLGSFARMIGSPVRVFRSVVCRLG